MKKMLFIIPARGGSKGIPGKNIKPLSGKPLIHYSLEFARQFVSDEEICVSTDSKEIAASVEGIGYTIPFLRPVELATDKAGSYEVLQHALNFYKNQGKVYEVVILLQPTSPFRKAEDMHEMIRLYNSSIDMIVSVNESAANPYYNLFEEGANGYLHISKGNGNYTRRQDVPKVYAYNGSIYLINASSLENKKAFSQFDKIVKYVMDEQPTDLDSPADWNYAEFLAQWKM